MTTPNDLLRIEQVEADYPFAPGTLRHWIRTGRLSSFRLGRRRFVRRRDVEQMIEQAIEAERAKREARAAPKGNTGT